MKKKLSESYTDRAKRKSFGQHFLKDSSVIRQIVEEALRLGELHSCQSLLEIGPGKGALTELLLQQKHPLLLVEKDTELANVWKESQQKASSSAPLQVIEADFMEVSPSDFLPTSPSTAPLLVVSNLPYSAGTGILERLTHFPQKIGAMVLMHQREVTQRVRADIDSSKDVKKKGSLSLWVQNLWEVKKLLAVAPGAFDPPPEVHSEVITLCPLSAARITDTPEGLQAWDQLIRLAFSQRRKMLRVVLKQNERWAKALKNSTVQDTLRAEQLTWAQWKELFNAGLPS